MPTPPPDEERPPEAATSAGGGGEEAAARTGQSGATVMKADELVARQERLPWNAFYLRAASMLGMGTFFDAFDAGMIGGIAAILLTQFHLTLLQEAGLISATYAGQFFGAWIFGGMAEKLGRKTTFQICLFIFGGLSLLCALAPDYNSLFYARALQGFGLGGEVPIAGSLLNELVQRRRRGFLIEAYELSFFGPGLYLAPALLALLNVVFGTAESWRIMFAIGFCPLPWAILAYFILPDSPRWLVDHGKLDKAEKEISRAEQKYTSRGKKLADPVIAPRVHADVKKTSFRELLSKNYRTRTFLIFTIWFASYWPQYGFSLLLPTIYVQITHTTLNQALLISASVSLFTGLGIPLGLYTSWLHDKLGRRFLVVFGFGSQTVVYVLAFVAFYFFHIAEWYILFFSTVSLFNLAAGTVYVYNPELYPTRMRAFATSAASSMSRLATVIAAPVNALLLGGAVAATKMTLSGLANVYLFIIAVTAFAFVVTLLFAPETAGRQLEEISS